MYYLRSVDAITHNTTTKDKTMTIHFNQSKIGLRKEYNELMYQYNTMIDIATNSPQQPSGYNYFLGEKITRIRLRQTHNEIVECVNAYNHICKIKIFAPKLNTLVKNVISGNLLKIM